MDPGFSTASGGKQELPDRSMQVRDKEYSKDAQYCVECSIRKRQALEVGPAKIDICKTLDSEMLTKLPKQLNVSQSANVDPAYFLVLEAFEGALIFSVIRALGEW